MKKILLTMVLLVSLLLTSMFLVGCNEEPDQRPPEGGHIPPHAGFVSGLFLNVTEKYIDIGQVVQLSPVFAPISVESRAVYWSSSDPYVVSVCNRGRIRGLAYGEATITAVGLIAEQELSATSRIVVGTPASPDPVNDTSYTPPPDDTPAYIPVQRITLERSTFVIIEGHNITLSHTIYPANATNQAVRWSSNNPALVVDPDTGTLTAIEATILPVTITVETLDGNQRAQAMATIMSNRVTLERLYLVGNAQINGVVGDTFSLANSLRFVPANAENQEVQWETNDTFFVSVDQNGLMVMLNPGNAVVTVRSVENANIFANFFVNILSPPNEP